MTTLVSENKINNRIS